MTSPQSQDTTETELQEAARQLEMILLDVDGVLTDGGIYYDSEDREIKRFDVKDGLGIVMAQDAGLDLGIITGRASPMVKRRAEELGIEQIYQGQEDKPEALREIQQTRSLDDNEIGYMGDDLTDLAVMETVGFSCAPRDAVKPVRNRALYVTKSRGGQGAVREWIDHLLEWRGQKHDQISTFTD
ncbi:MAG: KdsC family phosphatase [bacterium]